MALFLCSGAVFAQSSDSPPASVDKPLTLAATAPQQEALPKRQAHFPSLRALGPDEGVISFALATNDARGRMPDIVTLVGERERFELRPVSDGYAVNIGVYVAVLPAGRYHLMRTDDRQDFSWITLSPASQARLGDFDVVAGHSTDLGTLVVAVVGGLYMFSRAAVAENDVPALLQRMAPSSAARVARLPAGGGWRGEPSFNVLDEQMRVRPVGLPVLRELADGRLVGPTSMGQVLVRGVAGQWLTYSDRRVAPFVWATTGEKGGLLAVSDDGRLVAFEADGASREVALRGLPPGRLRYVGGSPGDGWFIGVEMSQALVLLRSANLDVQIWEEVGRVVSTQSNWTADRGFWIFDVPTGIVLVQGSQGLVRHYRYASRVLEDRHTPDRRDIHLVDLMPDGSLTILAVGAGGLGGPFANAYISPDLGETWREVNTGYTVKISPIAVPGDERLLQLGGVFGDAGLRQSHDDGKTWTQLSEALPADARLVPTRNHGLLAVRRLFGVHDVVLRSTDGGATWALEWSGLPRSSVEQVLTGEQAERDARAAKRANAKK
jgi:hypothetical protein